MLVRYVWFIVFFFKQKTAYEIRPRDWSSDVCSSDLIAKGQQVGVVKVSLDGELLESIPLVALEAVDEGGFIQIAKDYILRLIN